MRRSLRFGVLAGLLCSLVLLLPSLQAQQPVSTQSLPAAPRDPQATALLQRAFLALGGNLPADSVATGNIEIVAGSRTESGTVRISTRGFDQSSEQIDTSYQHRTLVYSRGRATQSDSGVAKALPLELAVTSQSYDFPLTLIAAALNDPRMGSAYIGLETHNGTSAYHVCVWTAPPKAGLEHIAEFSLKDLWIDATTGLPLKLACVRRAGLGATPRTRIEVSYSDYRQMSGIVYPFRIEETVNGLPWSTVTISAVNINVGLMDADFLMATGGAR